MSTLLASISLTTDPATFSRIIDCGRLGELDSRVHHPWLKHLSDNSSKMNVELSHKTHQNIHLIEKKRIRLRGRLEVFRQSRPEAHWCRQCP